MSSAEPNINSTASEGPAEGAGGEAEPAAPAETPAAEPPAAPLTSPWKVFVGRFMIAHMLAYPVGLLAGVAAMPAAMAFREKALLAAGDEGASTQLVKDVARDLKLTAIEAAQLQIVLEFLFWSSSAVLLVVHLLALPWALAASRSAAHPEQGSAATKRGLRTFVVGTLGLSALILLGGLIGWIWLFTL